MTRQRVVMVPGAPSGIGEATVRSLLADGAHVIAVARRKDRLERLAQGPPGGSGSVRSIVSDLTAPGEAPKLIEKAVDESGRLDALVNNAGIMLLGPVVGTDPAEWDQMLEINLHAVLRLTSA